MIFLILLLILSLTINCILFWYVRKLIEKLNYGVNNVDQLQELLEEYSKNLQSMLEMEMYYGDETMIATVNNTKMVIDLCRGYKKTIMVKEEQMSREYDTDSQREG